MKTLIILAAGQGTRLRPLTDDRPKCMVPFLGEPLLSRQMRAARAAGAERIVVVAGYRENRISADCIKIINPRFATTNMVESLWCAREYFGDAATVAYGDILYEPDVLRRLWECPHPSAVIVDTAWKDYWAQRFDDVLSDAESLRLDASGRIVDIGQKETRLENIQGQYIGMFRLGAEALAVAGKLRARQAMDTWYMTDLLQALMRTGVELYAVPVAGQWIEIDSLKDLELGEKLVRRQGELLRIRR